MTDTLTLWRPVGQRELDLVAETGRTRGKGGRRREVGMDDWGFEQLEPRLRARQAMPVGPLFCVIDGRTRGRAWHSSAAREALRRRAARTGVRRRFAPHQLRHAHAHALELLREVVPLNVIQRQLGHRNLGVTSIYLQAIDPDEINDTVHARRPPMTPPAWNSCGRGPADRHDARRHAARPRDAPPQTRHFGCSVGRSGRAPLVSGRTHTDAARRSLMASAAVVRVGDGFRLEVTVASTKAFTAAARPRGVKVGGRFGTAARTEPDPHHPDHAGGRRRPRTHRSPGVTNPTRNDTAGQAAVTGDLLLE
jgi:hypothetical protein